MNDLLEHILSENYVAASQIFEERLNSIVEKKLVEKKKMMQAEAMGGMSKQDIEDRKKAGFIKASHYFDVMDKLKEIEQEHKEKLKKPKTRKKKLDEDGETGWTKPSSELERRAKTSAEKLGKQFGKTAQAMADVDEKEPESKPSATKPQKGAFGIKKDDQPTAPTKQDDKLKKPDWAKLSKKTIANVKAQRRAEKIQSWKERGQTNKAKRLGRAIGYKKWNTSIKNTAKRIGDNPVLRTLGSMSSNPLSEENN